MQAVRIPEDVGRIAVQTDIGMARDKMSAKPWQAYASSLHLVLVLSRPSVDGGIALSCRHSEGAEQECVLLSLRSRQM